MRVCDCCRRGLASEERGTAIIGPLVRDRSYREVLWVCSRCKVPEILDLGVVMVSDVTAQEWMRLVDALVTFNDGYG